MNYCNQCGQPVILKIPVDDNRERFVCDHCGFVHYQNPNNICGAILTCGERILMCKRAIEPRYGLWTLPAGFMENNETVAEAAARESMEEANAESGPLALFGIFSMPYISQVYHMFHGELGNEQGVAGVIPLTDDDNSYKRDATVGRPGSPFTTRFADRPLSSKHVTQQQQDHISCRP